MKLKFKKQEFQEKAVEAVVSVFKGQEKLNMTFSIADNSRQMSLYQNDYGFANAFLGDEEIVQKNLNISQKANFLPLSDIDSLKALPLTVEMETGTGKTYVYTRTILELNKRCGFTKFIIVVPSVAIREGVFKSLQITQEHFAGIYDGVPYRFFIYNSQKLNDIRQFATSADIEVMIINIDAFKKAENIINQDQDKLNGESPMTYIRNTNPIVIVDEPQSVDNTSKAKEAIASLDPLCVLRYSATHRTKENLIYKLSPVDAYQMGLVKQITVISNSVVNDHNKPYIALKSVSNKSGFSAKIEIDIEDKKANVQRKIITVKAGDDLYVKSGNRELYEGYAIEGIDCTLGSECIEFTNSDKLALGQSIGSIDENIIKRSQIYHTIRTHLDKELRYFDKGIKVLSLFFIDEVKKYRQEDGTQGIYARFFEECYNELLEQEKYAVLKDKFNAEVSKAHNAYFSQDKKGVYKDTKGNTQADDSTYNTIMKDKEWLLSFECPLRFIFSHSALKEGWDNPNVFQVCTLLDQKSIFTCRQKIGRGLRLCVNQDGERIEDKNINILHVVANESFSDFATKLQKEIEEETGLKFGVLDIQHLLSVKYEEVVEVEREISPQMAENIVNTLQAESVIDDAGNLKKDIEEVEIPNISQALKTKVIEIVKASSSPISSVDFDKQNYTEKVLEEKSFNYSEAVSIMEDLKDNKVISKDCKIKDTMKAQLKAGTLDLSKRWSQAKMRAIMQALDKADNTPIIKDASKEVKVRLKKEAMLSPAFLKLWAKIKQKTMYKVQFDLATLIANSIEDISKMPSIEPARLLTQTADIDVAKEGVLHIEKTARSQKVEQNFLVLPDISRLISSKTSLKRQTINNILKSSGRFGEFLLNPQEFYEKTLDIIERNRHKLAIDGIKYVKLANEEYYIQEIFDTSELIATLDKNAVPVDNSIYDHVIYDSNTEGNFAKALDADDEVEMFFKIPSRFKIETPIGTYNPDWAVLLNDNGNKKLYFVLETKGTTDTMELRAKELLKIHCGKAHFKALDNDIEFTETPVVDWKKFKGNC